MGMVLSERVIKKINSHVTRRCGYAPSKVYKGCLEKSYLDIGSVNIVTCNIVGDVRMQSGDLYAAAMCTLQLDKFLPYWSF